MRDVMDIKGYTIAYVAKKADVSEKRIELIRSAKDDQDIKRSTARRIEQVIIGPATYHICDMDFDSTAADKIVALQEEVAYWKKENDRKAKIIDKYLE